MARHSLTALGVVCRWHNTPKELAEETNGHEIYQVACHVIERLAILSEQYNAMVVNSSTRFLPRWSDDALQAAPGR